MVWVSTGASVGQADPWWPPWPGSGLAGLGLGQTSCQWSPLWAALSGSGCYSTRSPARPPGGPAAARRPGCRRLPQNCGDAAPVPPAGRPRGSAGRSGLSWATTSASRCRGRLFPEAPKSCGGKESVDESKNSTSEIESDYVQTAANQITKKTISGFIFIDGKLENPYEATLNDCSGVIVQLVQ